jgi:hypothetical protein
LYHGVQNPSGRYQLKAVGTPLPKRNISGFGTARTMSGEEFLDGDEVVPPSMNIAFRDKRFVGMRGG